VRAIVENADGALLPGLFAKVRMGSADAATTILVNEKAISTDQNKKFVFVMGANNMPEFRELTLGQSVDGLRVVKTGLKANETIVVNGLMRIRPSAPVSPEPVDMVTLQAVK
jgi:multidrug efflux system membrane fusion protein